MKTFKCSHCNSSPPCFAITLNEVTPEGCLHDREPLKGIPKWKEASTSEIEESLGMQSSPAARDMTNITLALNAFAPDCLSAVVAALRPYVEQSQHNTVVTMTLAKGELDIKVTKA